MVYCFGHVSTGRIVRLRDRFPAADGYGEVLEEYENHSGEATGTALTLRALGVSVVLEGNWIGDNDPCRQSLEFLRDRGIDVSGLRVEPGYAGVREWVFSDGTTRTVFGRYCDLLFTERQWDWPREDVVQTAQIACVDPSFGEATLRVARAAWGSAENAQIPLVSCDAPWDGELCTLCTGALVISNEFLRRCYPDAVAPGRARRSLLEVYSQHCPGLVVFTAGAQPIIYARPNARGECLVGEVTPPQVQVLDSAGAGDSFRGGLIAALLERRRDHEAVRFAATVGALVCTTAPGCLHPPTKAQVQALM